MDTMLKLQNRLADAHEEITALNASADADRRDLTEDEASRVDSLLDECEHLESDIRRAERVIQNQTRIETGMGRQSQPEPSEAPASPLAASGPRISIRETGQWGWRNFGEFAQGVHQASMPGTQPDTRFVNAPTTVGVEGVGADGGFAVPPDFRLSIEKAVQGEDSLLALAFQMNTGSNTLVIPKDESTPWATSGGIQAYWEGENDQLTQSKPALESLSIRLNKLTALVPVTDELLEDAPAMTSYLNGKVPEVFTSKVNEVIVNGNGAGRPLGILQGGDLVTVAKETSQTADTVVMENIVKMWSRMYAPARRNAVWLINQDIEPQLLTMGFPTAATAVPVYLPANGLSATPYSTLMGRPVIPVEACETLGDKGDIIFANLSAYLAVIKTGGIQQAVSAHLYFDYATMAFRYILRVGGQPMHSGTVAKRAGSNTLARFVTLAARA